MGKIVQKVTASCLHKFHIVVFLVFFICLCGFNSPVYASDPSIPTCGEVEKEIKDSSTVLSPTMFDKLPMFKDFIGHIPENPQDGQEVQIHVDLPLNFPGGSQLRFVLYWQDNLRPENYNEVPMNEHIVEIQCKKKKSFLFIHNWKTVKKQVKKRFTAVIPPQKSGTTIAYFIKAFVITGYPFWSINGGALDSLFSNRKEKKFYGSIFALPAVQGLWEDKTVWENHPLLQTPDLSDKPVEIDKTQIATDGDYIYFRMKTKRSIHKEKCSEIPDYAFNMHAYGVQLVSPEYAPDEPGHSYALQGHFLAYAPCINGLFKAPDAALYESSTFKKGPMKESDSVEFKFFADNDLVMRFPCKKDANWGKLLMAIFMTGSTTSSYNPVGKLNLLDAMTHLIDLNHHSFTVQ